jgi:transposase
MTMPATALLERAHNDDVGEHDNPAPKPKRRVFTAKYKASVLSEYESLASDGAKGALLRREGLYSSHIVEWRKARDAGVLVALMPKTRAPRLSSEQREIERLRKDNARLVDQLGRYRLALEIQGKASELLESLLAESPETKPQQP